MNQARSGSRVNWRRVWPLIDLATGITGLALLAVGDLGGNRPLRALGVGPHRDRGHGRCRAPLLVARRQGAADRNAMTSRVGLGGQRAPGLLERNASQEDTRGGGFNSDDSILPASPEAGFGSRLLPEPVSACDTLTFRYAVRRLSPSSVEVCLCAIDRRRGPGGGIAPLRFGVGH